MMKKYESYRDSGFEWIGEIPDHWEISKLKRVTNFIYGDSLPNENRKEGVIPVYGSNGIVGYHDNSISKSPCIIVGRKGSYGKINYSYEECFPIDTTYFIDETATEKDLRWLYYLLFTLNLDSFSKDSAVPGLSREDAYERYVILPSKEEQKSIAIFLDKKTKQVNNLIQKKQKQIELLKEQRMAIINHAVTKGLNPNVKMKDSGIEWLGEIPDHWDTFCFKRIAKFKNGINFSSDEKGEGVLTADVLNMYGKGMFLDTTNFYRVNKKLENSDYYLEKNDFLFVRSSLKREGVGWNTIFNGFNEPVTYCGFLIRARLFRNDLNPLFYSYFFHSEIGRSSLISESNTVTITNIGQESLGNVLITFPPIQEQNLIVEYLNEKIAKVDDLLKKISIEISLLNEFRTVLISKAVTGKIDVRDKL